MDLGFEAEKTVPLRIGHVDFICVAETLSLIHIFFKGQNVVVVPGLKYCGALKNKYVH